jgi:hypothetical protein
MLNVKRNWALGYLHFTLIIRNIAFSVAFKGIMEDNTYNFR